MSHDTYGGFQELGMLAGHGERQGDTPSHNRFVIIRHVVPCRLVPYVGTQPDVHASVSYRRRSRFGLTLRVSQMCESEFSGLSSIPAAHYCPSGAEAGSLASPWPLDRAGGRSAAGRRVRRPTERVLAPTNHLSVLHARAAAVLDILLLWTA